VSLILRQNPRPQGAHCPFPGCACIDGGGPDGGGGGIRKVLTYDSETTARYTPYNSQPSQPLPPPSSGPMPPMRSAYAWDDRERDDVGSPHTSSASVSVGGSPARKHARSWDSEVSLSSIPPNPISFHPTRAVPHQDSPISHLFLTVVNPAFSHSLPCRVTRVVKSGVSRSLFIIIIFFLGGLGEKPKFTKLLYNPFRTTWR